MDEQFRLMCAAMAMQGMLAKGHDATRDPTVLAARSWDIADAMAAEWDKRRPSEAERIRKWNADIASRPWTAADADLGRG